MVDVISVVNEVVVSDSSLVNEEICIVGGELTVAEAISSVEAEVELKSAVIVLSVGSGVEFSVVDISSIEAKVGPAPSIGDVVELESFVYTKVPEEGLVELSLAVVISIRGREVVELPSVMVISFARVEVVVLELSSVLVINSAGNIVELGLSATADWRNAQKSLLD